MEVEVVPAEEEGDCKLPASDARVRVVVVKVIEGPWPPWTGVGADKERGVGKVTRADESTVSAFAEHSRAAHSVGVVVTVTVSVTARERRVSKKDLE